MTAAPGRPAGPEPASPDHIGPGPAAPSHAGLDSAGSKPSAAPAGVAGLEGARIAITGVDGFVGRHLARAAAAGGATVLGIGRAPGCSAELRPFLDRYLPADLREEWPLREPVDAVVHLAGLSAVGPSFADPQRYLADNSAMVTVLCEALVAHDAGTRLLGVSSGAVYAPPGPGAAVGEEHPLAPSSPYALSKVVVEQQLAYYRRRGLDAVVARPFNHAGPGQGPGFLVPDLVRRVAALAEGEPLTVGDLSRARDYSHVADVARAYLRLAVAPSLAHEVYNVASGRATSGEEILDRVCAALGRRRPALRVDEGLLRPGDPAVVVGSAERLRRDAGWRPELGVDDVIRDVVGEARG